MSRGIFLTGKDMMILLGTDHHTSACRKLRAVKKEMGKEDQPITIQEYCTFYHLSYEFIIQKLNQST